MDKRERIDYICEARRSGRTLDSIGKELCLSRERIRQICSKFGATKPRAARAKKPVAQKKERAMAFADIRRATLAAGLKDPYRAFLSHRNGAKNRGIPFKMTFEEWWGEWKDRFHLRGNGSRQLCMCRYMDSGSYEVGNVSIKTNRENQQERSLVYQTRHYSRKLQAKYGTTDLSNFYPSKSDGIEG